MAEGEASGSDFVFLTESTSAAAASTPQQPSLSSLTASPDVVTSQQAVVNHSEPSAATPLKPSLKSAASSEHLPSDGSVTVASRGTRKHRKKSSMVSFCDDVSEATTIQQPQVLDVREHIRGLFHLDYKPLSGKTDDLEKYTTSLMTSDLSLQQRLYLDEKSQSQYKVKFDRELNLEEELQARVVQLKEVARTWHQRYLTQKEDFLRLQEHVAACRRRCEEFTTKLSGSFTQTIVRLQKDLAFENQNKLDIIKEKHALESNLKKALSHNEDRYKELKQKYKDKRKSLKQLQTTTTECETLLERFREQNLLQQEKIRNKEAELLQLRDALKTKTGLIAELEHRDTCYANLVDILMDNNLNEKQSVENANVHREQDYIDVPNVGKYVLQVSSDKPTVMQLVEYVKSDDQRSDHTLPDDQNNNRLHKTCHDLDTTTSCTSSDMGSNCDNCTPDDCLEKAKLTSKLSHNSDSGSTLKRRDAFNLKAHQWKRANSDTAKSKARRSRPALFKHRTFDNDDESSSQSSTNVTRAKYCRNNSLDQTSTSETSNIELRRSSDDLSFLTRSEPVLPLDRDSPVVCGQDERVVDGFGDGRSAELSRKREDFSKCKAVSEDPPDGHHQGVAGQRSHSPRTGSQSSAFAVLRSRRNGIVGVSDELELQVKALRKPTKTQDFTAKLKKLARVGYNESSDTSKGKKKDRRSPKF